MNVYAPRLLKNILNGQFGKAGEKEALNTANPFGSIAGKNGKGRDDFNIQTNLMEFLDPTAGMDENEKSAYLERIMQKLKNGKKLSSEEMNYVRAKDPQLYLQAARVQSMRENLKHELENCTSKEAAENAYSTAAGMISDKDPMKEALIAAYNDAAKEFKKSDQYKALPDTEEEAKNKKDGQKDKNHSRAGKVDDMGMQDVKQMEGRYPWM